MRYLKSNAAIILQPTTYRNEKSGMHTHLYNNTVRTVIKLYNNFVWQNPITTHLTRPVVEGYEYDVFKC